MTDENRWRDKVKFRFLQTCVNYPFVKSAEHKLTSARMLITEFEILMVCASGVPCPRTNQHAHSPAPHVVCSGNSGCGSWTENSSKISSRHVHTPACVETNMLVTLQ